jgi:formiminotetrahydrofolate cyclodeaminase
VLHSDNCFRCVAPLVCDVLERHKPALLSEQRQKAWDLQQQLLAFVEEDAAAYRAFLDSQPGSTARQSSAARAAAVPMNIGRACREIAELARAITPDVSGVMQFDGGAANELAQAAARSALDIAEHNLGLIDPSTGATLEAQIARFRETAR